LVVKVLEKPLHPGWVYPCTVEEIEQQLLNFPPEDLEGLAVICLVPAIRRDLKDYTGLHGEYCQRKDKPTIDLFSWPESLIHKFPQGTKRYHLAHSTVHRSFGMQVEQIGTRWYCRWEREDWRRFVLEHVLVHEIGHHVCGPSEQLADDYALRYLRRLNGGTPPTTKRDRRADPCLPKSRSVGQSPTRFSWGHRFLFPSRVKCRIM
jgi:hypothetical protein